jgi:mannose-6-phosphate isomerase
MAIALTNFKAMCGFRPLQEIETYLTHVRELSALIPPTILARFSTVAYSPDPQGPMEKASLKEVWSALMTASPEQYQAELRKLVARYRAGDVQPEEMDLKDLVLRIDEQFPGDIGIFCVFILNVIDLKPGEAIFLGAGEPHAYISGGGQFFSELFSYSR